MTDDKQSEAICLMPKRLLATIDVCNSSSGFLSEAIVVGFASVKAVTP